MTQEDLRYHFFGLKEEHGGIEESEVQNEPDPVKKLERRVILRNIKTTSTSTDDDALTTADPLHQSPRLRRCI